MDGTLSVIQIALYLVVGGGMVYYIKLMKRQIDALKGAVEAQEKTIGAQGQIFRDFESLNKMMKTVIDTVDTPAMLKRWEDYKKLVNEESSQLLKRQTAQFAEEKNQITQLQHQALEAMGKTLGALVDLFGKTVPYIPPEERIKLINSIDIPSPTKQVVKEALHRIAEAASYLPVPHERSMEALRLFLHIQGIAESKVKDQADPEMVRALLLADVPKLLSTRPPSTSN